MLYSLTEEHRAQLKPWAYRWIANAMSTRPMDDADRAVMRIAVRGLYESARLKPPPDHRIIFVPSPLVLRLAGGFAAAIWHLRKQGTYAATSDATSAATYAATSDATYAATRDATSDATSDGSENWYRFPNMLNIAKAVLNSKLVPLGLSCAANSYNMWQGGNQWSAWTAWISFFREVVRLEIDYTKWQHFEDATVHAGPRIMHAEFCMISDRPRVLKVDDQNRPHNATGPFCAWSDGTELYSWHGVRVPCKYYLRAFAAKDLFSEPNAEVRRAVIERYEELNGKGQFFIDCGPTVLDKDKQPMRPGEPETLNELLSIELPGDPDGRMLGVRVTDPSTSRQYVLRVHPECRPMLNGQKFGKAQPLTVRNAIASTFGLRGEEYALMQES